MEEYNFKDNLIIYKEKCIDLMKYKIFPVIQQQKVLSAIIGGIILITGITLLIPTPGKNNQNVPTQFKTNAQQQISTTSNVENQNLTGALNPSIAIRSGTGSPQPTSSHQTNGATGNSSSQSTGSSGIGVGNSVNVTSQVSRVTPLISTTQVHGAGGASQGSSGGSSGSSGSSGSQSSQGSSGGQSNNSNGSSNGAPQIVFIGSDGQPQVYTEPPVPPVSVTWNTYYNTKDQYSIEYPSAWYIDNRKINGHDQIFIYLPGADPNDPNSQYISFGWSSSFTPPTASYTGVFALDGIPGTIYTNGTSGTSFIAAAFQYANGYLIINNNISSDIFTYLFSHMLYSVNFSPS